MLESVLLDVDGTLIDSNDAHAESWVQAFALEGIPVPFARIRPLIGMGGDHLLPLVSGFTEASPLGQKISDLRGEIFRREYLPKLKAFPRVRELLLRMKQEGLRLIVASSSDKESLDLLLKQTGVFDLIEMSTSKDDAGESKPDPDIILAALRSSRSHRDRTLMLGDTPYDITAASRAGVRTVAFTCGGWTSAHLAKAVAVYRDPEDLLLNFSTSPFSNDPSRSRARDDQRSAEL